MKLPGLSSEQFASKPFEGVALVLTLLLAFLLPLLVIPGSPALFLFSKSFLVGAVALISLLLIIASEMKERRVRFTYSPVFLAVWFIPIAYLLSAIFSSSTRTSLVGQVLETDTFAFIVFGAVLVTLMVTLLQKPIRAMYIYFATFLAGIVLFLFHLARFVGGADTFSFGVLNTTTSTPIGVWNDLAVFFGLLIVLALVTLMSKKASGTKAFFLYGAIVVGLFFLALVNFSTAWWMVGFFALGTFVYSVVSSGTKRVASLPTDESLQNIPSADQRQGGISFISLLVLAISLAFLFFGSSVGNFLANEFNTSFIDVRPSWESTIEIGKVTYSETPVFGSGANTFSKQWLLNKPGGINESLFWNTRFGSGIAFIPTSFITTGLVGTVAWVSFFLLFLYTGLRAFIVGASKNDYSYYLALSSFLAALYLWVAAVLYVPSVALLTLAFIFTGIFIGSLRFDERLFKELKISFVDSPKLGFIAVLVLTVVFLGSIAGLFSIGEKYAAAHSFQQALIEGNVDGNLDAARGSVQRAVSLDANDQYYRLAADIAVVDLTRLVQNNTAPNDEIRAEFQTLVAEGVQNAQAAIQIDTTNDLNWFALARVYQLVAPLQIEGAYENGVRAFEESLVYNPHSPELQLERARHELGVGDISEGERYTTLALSQKTNYTEAIYLLAQIQIAQGNVGSAIDSVRSAVFFDPENPVGFFQLGLLEYSEGNNANAAQALSQAVALDGNYANARYFLGLAQYRLGNVEESIVQFEEVQALNPNNQEVVVILENLKEGRAPVPGITFQTIDDIPELPVAEQTISE